MTDDQIKEFKQKRSADILHFPTVLGADVPSYNIPGVSAELNFTPEGNCWHLSGHDYEVE